MANLAIDKHMSTKITAFLKESIRAPGHAVMPGSGGQWEGNVCLCACVYFPSASHYAFSFAFNIGYLTRTFTYKTEHYSATLARMTTILVATRIFY